MPARSVVLHRDALDHEAPEVGIASAELHGAVARTLRDALKTRSLRLRRNCGKHDRCKPAHKSGRKKYSLHAHGRAAFALFSKLSILLPLSWSARYRRAR
jgi:hypothetical protein